MPLGSGILLVNDIGGGVEERRGPFSRLKRFCPQGCVQPCWLGGQVQPWQVGGDKVLLDKDWSSPIRNDTLASHQASDLPIGPPDREERLCVEITSVAGQPQLSVRPLESPATRTTISQPPGARHRWPRQTRGPEKARLWMDRRLSYARVHPLRLSRSEYDMSRRGWAESPQITIVVGIWSSMTSTLPLCCRFREVREVYEVCDIGHHVPTSAVYPRCRDTEQKRGPWACVS